VKDSATFLIVLRQADPRTLVFIGLRSGIHYCFIALLLYCFIALLMSLLFLPHWLKNRLSTTQRLYLNSLRVLEKAGTPRSIW
jgi:hypothetical protein